MPTTSYGGQALIFLLQLAFGLYITAVLLRLILQYARADFFNPLSQLLVQVTQPALRPLRRVLPAVGRLDTAALVLLLTLQVVEILLVGWVVGRIPAVPGAAVLALAELLSSAITLYVVLLVVRVVMSFMNPYSGATNPALDLVYQLTKPILVSLQRLIPPSGMFDWSVLVAFVLLSLARILVVQPLLDLGRALS